MNTKEIKDFREFKTIEDKVRFFETLQLHQLENFVKEQLGYKVKFKKTIYVDRTHDKVVMNLESQELKQLAGITQNIFESLTIKTFGNIQFKETVKGSINCDALFTDISFPDLSFIYYYKHGGQNGCTCITVNYDLNNRNWYFKGCKDNFKMNYACPGHWEGCYEQEELNRKIEIKEV